ncbi:hypothetical protein REPUB_Repub12eG0029300 [Reevesia pubescens]
MASIGFGSALCPTKSLLFSPCVLRVPSNKQTKHQLVIASSSTSSCKLTTEAAVSESTERHRTIFGLKNLAEIFWVDVHHAEGRPLNVRLDEPLTIASSRLEEIENVAIRVELSNGCVGWGEVTVLPWVNMNQATAIEKVREACEFLGQGPPVTLNLVLDQISKIVPASEFPNVSIL